MELYSAFTPIRNKLRKLERNSVVDWCICQLYKSYRNPPPIQRSLLPPQLLLFLKWAFAFCPPQSQSKRPASYDDCVHLYNQVLDLCGKDSWLTSGHPMALLKFTRRMAFHQFWWQRAFNHHVIARQRLIFIEDASAKFVRTQFQAAFGMDVEDFLNILLHVISAFVAQSNRTMIKVEDFSETTIERSSIEKFFANVSRDIDDAKEFAISISRGRSIDEQIVELSPFVQFPFLKRQDAFISYTPFLLFEFCRYFIYDLLKERFGREFSAPFGQLFERYIRRTLIEMKVPHLEASALQVHYPNCKLVDFVVPLKRTMLLIESKGMELAIHLRVNPDDEKLGKGLKSTIIKAYEQLYSTAHEISRDNKIALQNSNWDFHGFIITYKELYLHDGQVAWDEFVRAGLRNFLKEAGIEEGILSPKKIHFLSIDAWDRFLAIMRGDAQHAEDILFHAVEKNWGPDLSKDKMAPTAKLNFEQFMNDFPLSPEANPYLDTTFGEMVARLAHDYKHKRSKSGGKFPWEQ